jgi:HEAT repeat protein
MPPRTVRIATLVGTLFMLAGCVTMPATPAQSAAALDRSITLLQVQSSNPDPVTRANCVEALQPSPDPRAAAVIEQGLHDKEWLVRYASAIAIGKRKSAPYKPVLVDMAAKDPNESVRAASIYALRQLGDTANMNALARLLESSDATARANTAFVLGQMGDPSAIPLLESTRRETDSRVKFEITAALARLGNKNAQRIIIAQALSKYAEDQWVAMMVCADLPVDVAGNPLYLGMQEPPAQTPPDLRPLTVRRQLVAARSLGKLGSTQGRDIAIAHLADQDPSFRALSAMALGEILSPAGDSVILPLLSDSDPGVQRAAAAAIINIHCRTQAANS